MPSPLVIEPAAAGDEKSLTRYGSTLRNEKGQIVEGTTTPVLRRRNKGLALTDALKRNGSPDELAQLIVQLARRGDTTALRLWAMYTQSPEVVNRMVDDGDDPVGYETISDDELDLAIAQLESRLLGPKTAPLELEEGATSETGSQEPDRIRQAGRPRSEPLVFRAPSPADFDPAGTD